MHCRSSPRTSERLCRGRFFNDPIFAKPENAMSVGHSAIGTCPSFCSVASLVIFILVSVLSGCDLASDVDKGKLAAEQGDYAKAIKLFKQGILEGSVAAEYSLGKMYELGLGMQQDHSEAAKYYELAARKNYPYAQAALAILYAYGRGVPQDFGLSYMWSSLAAINYSRWSGAEKQAALRNRDIVAGRLSSAELMASQRAVEQFLETGKLNYVDKAPEMIKRAP